MAMAICLSGRQGQHDLINGIYEPTDRKHNDRGVWVSRAVRPLYLFHTGKSRWVISKRLDDGSACYAYIQDSGNDPLQAQGGWTCCDGGSQWQADPKLKMSGVSSSNDKFVLMRMALDQDMDKYGLNDDKSLKQMWKRLDCNGNGVVSLAEVDKLAVELVAGGTWPAWVNNKPALMRAFKKADMKDGDGDGWIEKAELHALLLNIFWFAKLWQIFDLVDTAHDRKISVGEFAKGMAQLDLKLSEAEAETLFKQIDRNHDGQIQFIEFCAYARDRVSPDADAGKDRDLQWDNYEKAGGGGSSGSRAARGGGAGKGQPRAQPPAQQGGLSKKNLSAFTELEGKINALVKDTDALRKLWRRLDFNGNGKVSLAEIDKMVVQDYPLLDHKPALMRAYKATCQQGDGDDFVEKKEFKSLLGNLFYFNKLFWLFDNADEGKDRRMDLKEFTWCLTMCGVKMSEHKAQQEFAKVDTNGGGIILFDEFCKYFMGKQCPQAMTEFVS